MYFAMHSGTLIYEHRYISTASPVCAGGVCFFARHIAVNQDRQAITGYDMRVVAWRALIYEQIIRWHFSMGQMEKSKWGKKEASPGAQPASGPPAQRPRLERPAQPSLASLCCSLLVHRQNLQTLPHGVGF